jgi:hypothetical protein
MIFGSGPGACTAAGEFIDCSGSVGALQGFAGFFDLLFPADVTVNGAGDKLDAAFYTSGHRDTSQKNNKKLVNYVY